MKTEPKVFKYVNLPVADLVHRAWRQECVASHRTLAQVLERAITEYVQAEAEKRAQSGKGTP